MGCFIFVNKKFFKNKNIFNRKYSKIKVTKGRKKTMLEENSKEDGGNKNLENFGQSNFQGLTKLYKLTEEEISALGLA